MKPRVIYIAGQSFSGSTIFCAVLGVHPQMEPVSELSMWSKFGLDPRRKCACGKLSTACEFWSAVRAGWLDGHASGILPRYVALQEKIEALSYAWPYLFGLGAPRGGEFEEFSKLTTSLFETLSEVSGRPIIVDSSKKPGRGSALLGMPGLDASVIHLVRSGMSYLDSNIRRQNLSPTEPDFLRKVFRLGVRWAIANYAAERAMRRSGRRGVRVRYEDLISRPVQVMQVIGDALQMDMQSVQDHVSAGRPIDFRHMESGSRHRRFGPAPLRVQAAHIPAFDARTRLAFYLPAGLLARRYGYV